MDTKKCTGCDVNKPIAQFRCETAIGVQTRKKCSACRETGRAYYRKNRDKIIFDNVQRQKRNRKARNQYSADYMSKIRALVHEKLGGVCCRCGFSDRRALQIDHVHSDGYMELRKGGLNTYAYLKKVLADTTGAYQLLCANCNWIKRYEQNEHPHRIREKHRQKAI